MRALIQRVTSASVTSESVLVGEIGSGMCILVGVTHDDTNSTALKLAAKVSQLRIFEDLDGQMNLDVTQAGGQLLVVSQFTLYADTARGRRPSYMAAAKPEHAEPIIEAFVAALRGYGLEVQTGRFRTTMSVAIVNDGPTTIMLEVD